MEFSDNTNKQGIVQDIDFLCRSTSATYPVAQKTRNVNNAVFEAQSIIWESTPGWWWEDSGRTDFPTVYGTLTHGTQDYRIAAISTIARHIKAVEVKDSNGDWRPVRPVDLSDLTRPRKEWYETSSLPIWYDLEGGFISLYPKPSSAQVTLASGLALYVSRDALLFSATNTTTTPGFAPQFHRFLSVSASIDFEKDPTQRAFLVRLKENIAEQMRNFYAHRNIEYQTRIKPRRRRHWKQYI